MVPRVGPMLPVTERHATCPQTNNAHLGVAVGLARMVYVSSHSPLRQALSRLIVIGGSAAAPRSTLAIPDPKHQPNPLTTRVASTTDVASSRKRYMVPVPSFSYSFSRASVWEGQDSRGGALRVPRHCDQVKSALGQRTCQSIADELADILDNKLIRIYEQHM